MDNAALESKIREMRLEIVDLKRGMETIKHQAKAQWNAIKALKKITEVTEKQG